MCKEAVTIAKIFMYYGKVSFIAFTLLPSSTSFKDKIKYVSFNLYLQYHLFWQTFYCLLRQIHDEFVQQGYSSYGKEAVYNVHLE